jgi:hypothetical protein
VNPLLKEFLVKGLTHALAFGCDVDHRSDNATHEIITYCREHGDIATSKLTWDDIIDDIVFTMKEADTHG